MQVDALQWRKTTPLPAGQIARVINGQLMQQLRVEIERLTDYHNGFERRLTDVHGHVIKEVLA